MIRGNVLFEVEKIEQLALINRLTTHHDLRPSLKGSDDGIMIRQYPRGLFQQHRSNSVVPVMSAARPLFLRKRTSIRDLAMSHSCHERTHALQQARRLVGYSITSSATTSSLRGT